MKNNKSNDTIYFSIREAAKQINVVPATIRNWEKAGLISARRAANGYRVFSLNDIEYLRKIKIKSKDENIGINGIRALMSDVYHDDNPEKDTTPIEDAASSKKFLGSIWRSARTKKGCSLEEVSKAVGISASYLSKIENEQANVSLEILERLANYYDKDIQPYLHNDTLPTEPIHRKDSSPYFSAGMPGTKINLQIADPSKTLKSLLYEIEPDTVKTETVHHNGEEFLYVLEGTLQFQLNDTTYEMNEGDSICFNSMEYHSWRNASNSKTVFIIVYTPLVKI